ncbi:MAG: DUF4956 domain-containing protein [Bacillota bacterium]|nr:DUF4956 domain-containing protein [Bacillota bacterium]
MEKYLYSIMRDSGGTLSIEEILMRLMVSILLGALIYLSYYLTHSGTIYSKKFNVTLVTLSVLTTMVMTVIGNNIALSLGMVGALSIIRFRTSIKDSRDTIYIFWTIIIGICCGVGDFVVAGFGSAAVFFVLLLFGRVRKENRTLLIIKAPRRYENEIRKNVFAYFEKAPVIKVQNTTNEKIELIYEIDHRELDKAEKKEAQAAIAEKRTKLSLSDKLYAIGEMDYVNIVVQSDEIS